VLDQEPRLLRVADLRWVAAQDLESYPFSPAEQATMDSILGLAQSDGNRTSGTACTDGYAQAQEHLTKTNYLY
jgi:hypothetical protein